jgi:hypothetical protein
MTRKRHVQHAIPTFLRTTIVQDESPLMLAVGRL